MGEIVDIAFKKITNDKAYVNEALENDLLGIAKQLFFSQLLNEYEKEQVIVLLYRQLNYENKCILETFIEENPSLTEKYNFAPHELKKSAN